MLWVWLLKRHGNEKEGGRVWGESRRFGDPVLTFVRGTHACSRNTVAYGINDAGQIVGNYNAGFDSVDGFVLSGGTYTTLDEPGEMTLGDVGHRFLEIQKKNAYELHVTVTVTHRMRVRVRAKNEAEAVAKAHLMDFEQIVEDNCDDVRVTSVDEQTVKPLEEQDRGGAPPASPESDA